MRGTTRLNRENGCRFESNSTRQGILFFAPNFLFYFFVFWVFSLSSFVCYLLSCYDLHFLFLFFSLHFCMSVWPWFGPHMHCYLSLISLSLCAPLWVVSSYVPVAWSSFQAAWCKNRHLFSNCQEEFPVDVGESHPNRLLIQQNLNTYICVIPNANNPF